MEFITDTVLFETKSHASCVSYAAAAPLVSDMLRRLSEVCNYFSSSPASCF